jgi:polyphenol oxidase
MVLNPVKLTGFSSPSMSYGFFTRHGGVSSGIYGTLNCGLSSQDNPAHVRENRKIVKEFLKADHLQGLYQIHSNICHIIDKPIMGENPQGDGLVTRTRGLALGVLTADCGPLLFSAADKSGHPIIGAAHAGWGGALKGMSDSVLKLMRELGAIDETLKIAIGPCIGKESYEVSDDFLHPFLSEDKGALNFFQRYPKTEKYHFDLEGYLRFRLLRSGIQPQQIFRASMDTYSHEDLFFSYRRKTHRSEPDYGRQISAIVID